MLEETRVGSEAPPRNTTHGPGEGAITVAIDSSNRPFILSRAIGQEKIRAISCARYRFLPTSVQSDGWGSGVL